MLGRWALKFYEQLIINCAVLCDGCSGSDGLVKIWNVRTNECVTTLDQHTEKVRIHTLFTAGIVSSIAVVRD